MGLNNRKDMGSDGSNGIAVEGFEVFPCCLAPLDDGVRVLPPAVVLSGHFWVMQSSTSLIAATTVSKFSFWTLASYTSTLNCALAL